MTGDRLDELAAAWSTDDPDPALRAELEDRLRHDPVARQRFLDHCVAEMALVESLASAAEATQAQATQAQATPVQATQPKAKRGISHPRSRSPLGGFRAVPIALWAAGLAALLMVALLFIPRSDAVQVTAGSVVADGRTFLHGSRITLPLTNAIAGADGVELNDPAGIVMRAGPASAFAITSPGTVRLEFGQLTLDVDGKRAPPTAVHTDELVVNVVGTRFRVARSTAKTDVDVVRGTVRVTTPDHTVQELTTGMRIAADAKGFISADRQKSLTLRLIYLAEDQSQRILEPLDQPLRVPANRPFTLRLETSDVVDAVSFRLVSNQNLPKHPRRIEVTRPFDLWGDENSQPIFYSLPAGTHRLTITTFADDLGEQPLDTRQLILIAE